MREAGAEIEKESYFRPGIAPVQAFPGYDVTIVYFMDYQCPSCRQYTPDVARVLAEDRKVRIIYRDTPIISDMSTVAARAAIAASFQGRHAAFHHALMMSKGQMTDLGAATGPAFDRMFLEMMVEHHQGAVAMAKDELAQGANPEAKQLAQAIIDGQSTEIAQMKSMMT